MLRSSSHFARIALTATPKDNVQSVSCRHATEGPRTDACSGIRPEDNTFSGEIRHFREGFFGAVKKEEENNKRQL